MNPGDYTILFGIGIVMAFCDAFGIGANNVVNSFATSVGSGSITLVQALIIACFCEFGGSFFLGVNTTETIKGGIVQPSMYADTPELLMLTMVCALIGSTTWGLFASSKGLPVSTTHAIVSAITSASISAFRLKGVQWDGIATIVLSWVAPLLQLHFVLKHHDSFRRGVIAIPAYFGVALTVQDFYIIFKGATKSDLRKASIGIPIGIAVVPYFRRKIQDDEDLKWCHVFYIPMVSERVKPALDQEETAEKDGMVLAFLSLMASSNDVANAIGPLATIYHVWVHSSVDLKKTAVPIWILVLGGVAIDIGLMTYGYHMATSITILTCSKLKLPVSFTQCVTGATASIDLLSGSGFRSLNYKALLIVLVAASSLS
ncbi:hypothetical protein MVEG_06953 [Podila verticillata NRRL 6337]|nr:hypothetical protein MVEG_06953 [Podila verticillata NRRL 6337]